MLSVGDWVKVPMRTGLHKGAYRWSAKVLEVRDDGFVKVTLRGPNQAYWIKASEAIPLRLKEFGPPEEVGGPESSIKS